MKRKTDWFPLLIILLGAALMIFISCGSPSTIGAKKNDTIFLAKEFIPIHDTLVIIQTYDSLPRPVRDTTKGVLFVLAGGWSMQPIELFKDGKTIDTIRKHEIIYY